ncbi:MAG: Rrf2 family transcriptional regulator [Actinobacteria bacterium]|nr:MAG: Rrf2 family transcriptional regulator [Actinomycetota bacterium]
MRVSQRLDYAVRALVELARLDPGESISAGEVAARLGLPKRFLEQQLTALARAGIVSGRRGSGGGCALAAPADSLTVAAVARAVERDVLDVPHTSASAVAEMWADAADALDAHLGEVTIARLAERQDAIDAEAAGMYYL